MSGYRARGNISPTVTPESRRVAERQLEKIAVKMPAKSPSRERYLLY
jgi:hypothetical protein